MDAKVFGQFIAKRRKEKNMTQAELAAKISVTDKAVSRWERGLGFPDISTIEPLAAALDLTVPELMRSEKADMENKKGNLYNGQDLTELMNQAVEMNRMNQRQDKIANWIAGIIIIAVTAVLWISGKANLLGGAFVGAIAAVAVVGMYLYVRNQRDTEGRRIYGAFMLGGVAGCMTLLNLVGVSDRQIMWILYLLLTLLVVLSNRKIS